MDIDNNKPQEVLLRQTIIFYEESEPNTWGSADIIYEIYYSSKNGIMQVLKVNSFGDRTLAARYQDRRNRGITVKEMIENIEQISNMTYKDFKEKILKEDK